MIEVCGVSKSFGTFRAVDDVSFSISTGEIVGLLGPNGAGKTTTMRMITGYLKPDSGTIKIDGMDAENFPVESKRKIGYMPENAPMYGDMIVEDYLRYVAQMEQKNSAEKIPELVKVCGLKEIMHKNIGELSRGNRQRVGLAHALMGDPEILILDEPTSGLDPNQVQEVRALIKKIGETRTVIISTHILTEAETLCSRVIIVSGGKKVADSSTEDLREKFGGKSCVVLSVEKNGGSEFSGQIDSVSGATLISAEEKNGRTELKISVEKDAEIRPALAELCVKNGWLLYEMQLKKNSLEDVFKILTNSSGE